MQKSITVSAPGKLMFLGEHAVVYNRPCIMTTVNQRLHMTVEVTDDQIFQLNAPEVKILNYKKSIDDLGQGDIPKGAKFVEIAVKNFLKKHHISSGFKITTNSEFSSLYGFGSSSASTVCTIKALSEMLNIQMSSREIFDLCFQTVSDIEGKRSGYDVAAAVYGGTMYFVTGGKIIEPLAIKNLPIVVGYTGIKASTPQLIAEVANRAQQFPALFEGIFNSMALSVEEAKTALLGEDWLRFGKVMDIAQGFSSSMGVSIRKLEDMIYAAREAGAYGAKLSGAGGGDCMIAVVSPEKKDAVCQAIEQVGGRVIPVETNVPGVRVDRVNLK